MSVVFYLMGFGLMAGGVGLGLFLWALKSGQYEDLDGAARRILYDGDEPN